MSLVARRLRHGVPSRRNRRKVASTRTVAAGGCPGPASRCPSQHPTTVAIRSNILKSNLPHSEKPEMGIVLGWLAVGSTQPRVVVETASNAIALNDLIQAVWPN